MAFGGSLLRREDEGYDAARAIFNGMTTAGRR